MTKAQIEALRREVEQMAAAGASRNEFREWADAYYFGIEDLYEVVKLMVDEWTPTGSGSTRTNRKPGT